MFKDPIAIIGIGCRFPGGVNDVGSFWKLLSEGREAVSDVPHDRWNIERFFDPETGLPGKSITKRGGFLQEIDQFDAQFFGISPREAPYVDPQHRLLLETAWEAIEDAGIVLDFERGSDVGVFVGISHNEYQGIQGNPWDHTGIGPHSSTGCAHSIAANRISYCFNLRGPSVAMDTACSSALTAVHAACEYIRSNRGDLALAGGVTVMIAPGGFIGFSQASMLSPDGHCKAFDASANGFVRGEGAGMVLLKRLSRALADNDPIYGLIIGTAINQDGHTNGISVPSYEAQSRLVREACADAGISPSQVGFVEAHGTGTAVGDPIEAHALAEALCQDRTSDKPLPIGSVKTNLGHLETAAGVPGLVKALLVLKHRQIPPSLHFEKPNPNIDFATLKLRVPTSLEAFPETNGSRIVGVNSFGFGGANAHVLVAEPPALQPSDHSKTDPATCENERGWPLVLSARSEVALRSLAERLSVWMDERSKSNGDSPVLSDLVYTLGARRNHHSYRLTLVAQTIEEAVAELNAFATDQQAAKVRTAFTPQGGTLPRVAFVMSGQGPQWWGMGRELFQHETVFRETVERCAAAIRPWARFDLLEELGRTQESSQLHRTEIAQPAIFALQVGLAALWKSWGVQPTVIVGHSVGEIAAACVAGILSLEDAARVITLRARFMEDCARGAGTMLAIGLDEESARALIARYDRNVTISAFNGPRSVTLSGVRKSLEAIASELELDGVFARFVAVDHPFHHPLMKPASESLERALNDLVPQQETVPFYSSVTGARCPGTSCNGAHWAQGILQPVRFQPAIDAMIDAGVDVWLEISAHPALAHSIQECLSARSIKSPVLSSSRRDSEHETTLETAMSLHRAGVALDFLKLTPSRRLLSLPTYAWDKSRWWSESSDWRESRLGSGGRGLLEVRLPRANPSWVMRLDPRHMAFLKDHKVENLVIFPAAAFVELVLEAGVQLFEGRPFVIEDFEIRKPLIIPDPASGLQTEISYNPNDRTFAVWSKLDRSPTWSLHVVGSLRSERVDSDFAKASSDKSPGSFDESLERVKVEDYYGYLRDIGLRYGDEFRPIRELAAGNGQSRGKVHVSDTIVARAGEYSLHPVLLDGALQIFSAGAATVEQKKTQLKLPVHFAKILFLRSPGAGSIVRAETQQCSDEYVEGKIELYDETGRPCVLVEGFRAISVSGARRGAAQSSSRNVVYHLEWEQTPGVSDSTRLNPVPLTRLREVAQAALDQVLDLRGRSELEKAMAAGDEMAAAQISSGLRKMLGRTSNRFSADSLGIGEPMRPIFKRLVSALVKRGWVKTTADGSKATADGFEVTKLFTDAADSANESLRTFISRYSGHLPEALLCAATCAELGPILRGEKDAVHVLFSEGSVDLLDEFYGEGVYSSQWLTAIAAAVQEAIRHAPEGYVLRILEIGAGTGGLSAQVLTAIAGESYSYVFSDVSPVFFSSAAQKLAAYPGVEYKTFDIEKSGVEQGFEAGSFDFVIGSNVVHAAKDLRSALRHIYELLAPGGTLAFMDLAHSHLWTDAVFGLTSGWWRFEDRDLRQMHPLLERSAWEAVLRQTGFTETVSLPGLHGLEGEGQIGLMARKPWSPMAASLSVQKVSATSDGTSWLVFADGSNLSERLIEQFSSQGTRCRVVRPGNRFEHTGHDSFTLRTSELEDWNELFRQCAAEAPPERFVYLWALDDSAETDPGLMGTEPLLHLVQATENTKYPVKFRIDLVTRGAQPAGRAGTTTGVAQAPVLGLLRVIRNEYPNVSGRAIDLESDLTPSDLSRLWAELHRTDSEREVAYRGEARYVQRLVRGQSSRDEWLDSEIPIRLETRERGHLEGLHFAAFTPRPCGPGEVLIDVKAAGLNFRDALKALGLYPGEAPDANAFGDEVAGVVKEVGSGVDHVAPGDKVFGLSVFGLASQTVTRGSDVRRMPSGLSFEQAATLPVVFMTAWHALLNVARLRKGEWILVHAGAGGVGMAAIQIAHHIGAKVIATAGSATKRALLEILGVERVIDSRRADFTDTVLKKTNGRGVDVVLNALAGEAIPMGLSCLGEFGRFIEIGKRDIYLNTRIPLRPLRNNASFHVVAMDAVFARDEALTRQLLAEVANLVEHGGLVSLPFRSFPASRAEAAFRLLAQGKHIGKVIVTFPQPFLPRRGEALKPGFSIRSDGTYLITGAFGGFGRVLARWLVRSGARHLVLTSRSGPATPDAEAFLDDLRALGTEVKVVRGDVGVAKDVDRLMNEVRGLNQPLRGIFHLAMVIDDAPLAALTPERMRSVIAPKAHGAWLLHESTRDLPLDCFVMFSSVSSLFGNPGQGNYASANAFLDALAHHRQALGLPALTVNWGVLGEEGYVARMERVAEFLARQGTTELSPGEVTSLLESFLSAGSAQVMAIRVDWTKWRQFFRGMQEHPLLERLFATIEGQDTVERSSDLRLKIESASPEELEGLVSQAVREAVGSVLRVKPDSLRDDQPLTDLGLDSLMGVEIESSIEGSTGVSLPPASLIRARTIGQIVELIIEHMGAKRPGATPVVESKPTAESASANEVNFEALSDEEIEGLLNAEAGRKKDA